MYRRHFKNKLFISISVMYYPVHWLEAFSIAGTELICKLLTCINTELMVGLNVGQAQVKFSQVFPVYLQIGEAVTPPLVKSRPILMRQIPVMQ